LRDMFALLRVGCIWANERSTPARVAATAFHLTVPRAPRLSAPAVDSADTERGRSTRSPRQDP
jgi:hypothetical protein